MVFALFNFLIFTVSWNQTPSLGLKKQRENYKVWTLCALSGSAEVKIRMGQFLVAVQPCCSGDARALLKQALA